MFSFFADSCFARSILPPDRSEFEFVITHFDSAVVCVSYCRPRSLQVIFGVTQTFDEIA